MLYSCRPKGISGHREPSLSIAKEIRPILYRSRPCTPGSHLAHSSYRVMPICVNLGQADCTAAAIAVQNGQQVRDIPVVRLQQIFLDASASGSAAILTPSKRLAKSPRIF
ncbi:MAG: FAD-dependent oxidoreductase [Lachnospiraceae bacterium]|nr:FAD-dependent oxidoreductase [uncultured Acetatifactor sp.]MCI9573888.1 FAD-dependent oxidoreductase [Lachnospiraceae bacterium]